MPSYSLTEDAEADLREIADYTLDTWGVSQALKYIDILYDHFVLLGQQPAIGRWCHSLAYEIGLMRRLRRVEVEKHVVFYVEQEQGVLIIRVLHASVLPLARYFRDIE